MSAQNHLEPSSQSTDHISVMSLKPDLLLHEYIDETSLWPQQIELLVKWLPETIKGVQVRAQEVVSCYPIESCDFYNPDDSDKPDIAKRARCKAILLQYAQQARFILHESEGVVRGKSYRNWNIAVPENNVLYTKAFSSQTSGLLPQSRQNLGQGQCLVTAPKTGLQKQNLLPLLHYGAFIPVGGCIDSIEQVYASIATATDKTIIKLHLESKLKEIGIVPCLTGRSRDWEYYFVEGGQVAQTSIFNDIVAGKVKITVQRDNDEKSYKSVSYRKAGNGNQMIYLLFMMQE